MKKLSLKDIKSGLLMDAPEQISVEIKFKGEATFFETYILPFSYDTAVAQMKAYGEKKEALAGILASVICDENGKLIFTETDVRTKFNQALVDAIWTKIVEVNMLGKKPSLAPTTNLSSKSESQSVKPTAKSKSSKSRKSKDTQATSTNTAASTSDDA
ncbi:phage tail assembly chaperone family protein, TAC [Acinetobacter sp. CFCC 10889]|uniref:phage tail assembly chaperone family protein, TAC n=1 Tax=Acinetobacter sp. CFCC 10889 TaxID=1775557 RepID=UPI000DCFC684|nr:phage tail assembly chaperone family protein, TAC [Acinetobacter sp. CFCC 10889]